MKVGHLRKLLLGEFPPEGSWDFYPVFREDGAVVAFVRARLTAQGVLTKLMVVDVQSLQTRELIPETGGVAAASYSATDHRILVSSGQGLEIISDGSTDSQLLLPAAWLNGRLVDSVTWSSTGQEVLFAVRRTDIQQAEVFRMAADKSSRPISIAVLPARMVTALRALK